MCGTPEARRYATVTGIRDKTDPLWGSCPIQTDDMLGTVIENGQSVQVVEPYFGGMFPIEEYVFENVDKKVAATTTIDSMKSDYKGSLLDLKTSFPKFADICNEASEKGTKRFSSAGSCGEVSGYPFRGNSADKPYQFYFEIDYPNLDLSDAGAWISRALEQVTGDDEMCGGMEWRVGHRNACFLDAYVLVELALCGVLPNRVHDMRGLTSDVLPATFLLLRCVQSLCEGEDRRVQASKVRRVCFVCMVCENFLIFVTFFGIKL